MIVLRSVAFNVLFYITFAVASISLLPCLVSRRGVLFAAKTWGRMNLFLLRWVAGIRVEVRGRENIPQGGALIPSKHQSALETVTMFLNLPSFAIILKRELNWLPIFGWYSVRGEMIPVNRGARSQALRAMTQKAKEAVGLGRQIIIFPEGTRRPVDAEPAYKYGVAHLYTSLGVPAVPMALNTGLFWPRRKFLRYPGTAVLEFLPPIEPGLDTETFLNRLRQDIETATDRLVAEARARGEGAPARTAH